MSDLYDYSIVKGYCEICKCKKSNIVKYERRFANDRSLYIFNNPWIKKRCMDCLNKLKGYKLIKCKCGEDKLEIEGD